MIRTDSTKKCIQDVNWLCGRYPKNSFVWMTAFMFYHNMADQDLCTREKALTFLNKAIQAGANLKQEQLQSKPQYAAYRQLPEFSATLKSMGSAVEKKQHADASKPIGRFLDPITCEP